MSHSTQNKVRVYLALNQNAPHSEVVDLFNALKRMGGQVVHRTNIASRFDDVIAAPRDMVFFDAFEFPNHKKRSVVDQFLGLVRDRNETLLGFVTKDQAGISEGAHHSVAPFIAQNRKNISYSA